MSQVKRLNDLGPEEGRSSSEMKRNRLSPSFTTLIRGATAMRSLNISSHIEPMLRNLVQQEAERGVHQWATSLQRSPSMVHGHALEQPTRQLKISNKLLTPIFTGTKIEAEDKSQLQVFITSTSSATLHLPSLPASIKLEIVAVDGDFPADERGGWTQEEFEKKIIKERPGKRPLITGETSIILRNGVGSIGDIAFTDNSSWIRSRKFRVGVRVAGGSQELRIKEAVSEAFMVKDQRGEMNMKHHPPSLDDNVWRLKGIRRDGTFHSRLAAKGIETVQDFLKLWVVDPNRLRQILGTNARERMYEKLWETIVSHAIKSKMTGKLYVHGNSTSTIVLNEICQVVGSIIHGVPHSPSSLHGLLKNHVERMRMEAYNKWDTLHSIDEALATTTLQQIDVEPPQIHPTQECAQQDQVFDVENSQVDYILGLDSSMDFFYQS